MRKANTGDGFFLCFLANLLLNCEWGLIALLLWAISYWFGFSGYPAAVLSAFWVLMAFGITSVLAWSSGVESYPRNQDLPNVNPYSSGSASNEEDVSRTPFKRNNKYYGE